MYLNNGLWEHTTYDPNRLQPTQIGLGTSKTDSSTLRLDYTYGTTDNNGNVQSQTITAPGLSVTQSYTYDALNRLTNAQESGSQSWTQVFSYDRFGNRNFASGTTTPTSGVNNPAINSGTNRIADNQGYGYDSAGNLTTILQGSGSHSLSYDGENRQTSYDSGNTNIGGASYVYDGDGRRVKSISATGTTVYVYDAGGQMVAEYSNASAGTDGTSYMTADALGTPRVITNSSGVASRHDYYPYGEEIGRSTQGYGGSDTLRKKFTGKERDVETGLDYFEARYFSPAQGRFTSPDEFGGGAREIFTLGTGDQERQALPYAEIANPQSLHKYAYVYNNPLRFTDPNGHQGQESWVTRLLRWFVRQQDPQGEAEQPRGGPLSMDADKVTAQTAQGIATNTWRTFEEGEKYGLDFGVAELARQMDRKDAVGTAIAATFLAINILSTSGGGGALEKAAGEQLSKRFIVTKGEEVVAGMKGVQMADWLAVAKDGSRGIVMEVTTGTNKSITTIRRQLENGVKELISQGVKKVYPYVMVDSKKAAKRIEQNLGKINGQDVKIIIAQ